MQHKDSSIRIRIDATTKRQLAAEAARHGQSLSSFLRRAALAHARDYDPQVEREILDELVQLREQIGRAGNNLNQIARKVNRGGSLPDGYVQKLTGWAEAVNKRIGAALDERRSR